MSFPIHDAVTAVLLHGDDLYVMRRQPHLAAFPGYWAFPGGKVDKSDHGGPLGHPVFDAHPPHLMRALVRELREETGADLEALARDGTLKAIAAMGEVTTPAFAPLRFRTWFFRLDFTRRPQLVPDPGETAEADWQTPRLWRERYQKGVMMMVPPTRLTIEHLAAHPDAAVIPAFDVVFDLEREVPRIEPIHGLRIVLVRSNTLPPAEHTNAFLLGDRGARQVLVDPAPASRDELKKLFTVLDEDRPDEVFLTHHHPDHREFADDIARRYGIPLGMSADTRQRIATKTGGKFFDGVEVKTYGDGDRLTELHGEPVELFAVPGHDEGQLAVMPKSRAWCIVSDLFQGVGTVVIGGNEGNMRKYFASLQRVIDLDPAAVVPSHGLAMGTTYRIKETLKHRKLREQQVKALHAAGKSPAEMVPEIYQGLDTRLVPFARMNIDSHLAKLREEGVIA